MKSDKMRQALGTACLALSLGLVVLLLGLVMTERMNRPQPITMTLRPQTAQPIFVPDHTGKLNLNTATLAQLKTLPGIGQHLAEQIIAQREKNPFYFIEDLMVIKGIGDKRIAALREVAYVALPEILTQQTP